MTPRKWTPERIALMHAEYADAADWSAFLAKINALPGRPVKSRKSMNAKASKMGLAKSPAAMAAITATMAEQGRHHGRPHGSLDQAPRKRREVTLKPAYLPAYPESDNPADHAIRFKHGLARTMLAAKREPATIAAQCGLPLREVFRLAGEMR